MFKRRTMCSLITAVALVIFIQGCGKGETPTNSDAQDANGYASADNPNASVSPVLRALKGRWVEAIHSNIKPDIPTMNLFISANNTLRGRFLVAGGFTDQGVDCTVTQSGDTITMTLVDDELRPHQWIPKVRVFKGKYDDAKKTLELKTSDGEWVRWNLSNAFTSWKASYSQNIYTCRLIPTPTNTPAPLVSHHHSSASASSAEFEMITADPTPSPTPSMPISNVSCGVMQRFEVEWDRMSGSQ